MLHELWYLMSSNDQGSTNYQIEFLSKRLIHDFTRAFKSYSHKTPERFRKLSNFEKSEQGNYIDLNHKNYFNFDLDHSKTLLNELTK